MSRMLWVLTLVLMCIAATSVVMASMERLGVYCVCGQHPPGPILIPATSLPGTASLDSTRP